MGVSRANGSSVATLKPPAYRSIHNSAGGAPAIPLMRVDVDKRAPAGARSGPLRVRRRSSVVAFSCLLLLGVLVLLALPGMAQGGTYKDVPKSHWARAYVSWVTAQKVGKFSLLSDFADGAFKPKQSLTRAQLARVLVFALRRQGDKYKAVDLADVPADHPYSREIQVALKLKLLAPYKDGFHPDEPVVLWQFHKAAVRAVRVRYPSEDWTMLSSLDPANWEPNAGWKPKPPKYFATEVAARYLGLRFNHPSNDDKLELTPLDEVRRDEAAYTVYQMLHLSQWRVYSLRTFNNVRFPKLSARQKEILTFAFKWVGYPHIYGGEFPKVNSPYGTQLHGGFDCSGYDWWVMKITFKYPIPISERSAAQMAAGAKPRIKRKNLQACDLIFFGPQGPKSSASSSYHAALYIGNGWFFNSTGNTAGVSFGSVDWSGWAWGPDLMWGRRVLKKSELPAAKPTATPTASPSPSASGSSSASPSPSGSASAAGD
jgi:hypothetical protein